MADEWVLNEGERLDDLVRDDMKLIQRPDHFCFSVDSVVLAHYVEPKKMMSSPILEQAQVLLHCLSLHSAAIILRLLNWTL